VSSQTAYGQPERFRRTLHHRLPRAALWCLTPGKGLGGVILAGFFVSAAVDRGGHAALWYLVAVMGFWWLAIMLVAALIPPPEPLRNQSALVSRAGSFVKALWKAFTFGAAAAYGALVSISINALPQTAAGDELLTMAWQNIWPILQMTAVAVGWYTAMACAWDLWRSGADARQQAIHTMRTTLEPYLPPWRRNPSSLDWTEAVMRWCVGSARPAVAAYLAPVAVAVVWDVLKQ